MSDAMTRERILDAAEQVFRKYGLEKGNVVDVAKALNVSHAAIYRHFPSKSSLREAVSQRWLHRVSDRLRQITELPGQPAERLYDWLHSLSAMKRAKAKEDPELFAMYTALAAEALHTVHAHEEELVGQLARIVREGMDASAFRVQDERVVATAIFLSTARFHHPFHVKDWEDPDLELKFQAVWSLLLAGISSARRD